jgi:hypothetical protein
MDVRRRLVTGKDVDRLVGIMKFVILALFLSFVCYKMLMLAFL